MVCPDIIFSSLLLIYFAIVAYNSKIFIEAGRVKGGGRRLHLDAKKEVRRDGVPPIELVDGEALIEMFERLELVLLRRRVYDIDEKFFEEYRK
jgi:hypothetical protein